MSRRSDEILARTMARKRWVDDGGPLRVMTVCEGYVMARRPGAAPLVATLREFKAKAREVEHG